MRLTGRTVILVGDGDAADAKRRLLERAGAVIVGEAGTAALAIVAVDDDATALAAIDRLKRRGVLVNAVDRADACDFTLPAIVDRDPVLLAIGTGGASAGLAKALRQRLEAILPATIGRLAERLHGARAALRSAYPDPAARRSAIDTALAPGGPLDPLADRAVPDDWITSLATHGPDSTETIALRSVDPDDLTLKHARWLSQADRVVHDGTVPAAILDRARADAIRTTDGTTAGHGLTIVLTMATS